MKVRLYNLLHLATALMLFATAVSCRDPLFVAGDEMYNAVLHTDWRSYQAKDPDGMTAWFYPDDASAKAYRYTTANVRELRFNVPSGRYTGVIIDYSPAEYGKQEFLGMDYASTALVQATAAGAQPDSIEALYGPGCWREPIGKVRSVTGLYEVANQPEPMALDTLRNMDVLSGEYGFYIPYKLRDTYQGNIEVQHFYSYPVSPIWDLRIRIFVKGFTMIRDIEGSVAGLANGRFLAGNNPTDVPCLLSLTGWETIQTGADEGYISVSAKTFGIRNSQQPHSIIRDGSKSSGESETKMKESAVIADWADTALLRPDDIRLNLRILLRDQATIKYYHYDVGEHIVSYDDNLILWVELGRDYPGTPDLPFVEPFNSAGFDADVTPWVDGGSADVGM